MPSVQIIGRVEPAWLSLTFDVQPKVEYRIEQIGVDLSCTIYVENSVVRAECSLNKWSDEVLSWILGYVYDFVAAQTNIFTFASGKVLHVHLDSVVHPDGSIVGLMPEAPYLAMLATACRTLVGEHHSVHVNMMDALPIVLGNPTLMLAMHDACSALKWGTNSLTNCGRAIEGMRKSLWGKDEVGKNEERQSWEKFRSTLRLTQAYLTHVTSLSTQPRHGSSAYVESHDKQEALRRTWTVLNRLLLWHIRGQQELPEIEFPEL